MSVEVRIARLDVGADALARALSVLGADERARAETLLEPSERKRFVAARGALRFMLADVLGGDPAALKFARGPFGKPYLTENGKAHCLQFSLSHARDLLAVAWSTGGAVGIDIECPRARLAGDLDAMAAHVLNGAERNALSLLPRRARESAFYRLWTRKEALAKASGAGFSLSPAEIPAQAQGWCGLSLSDLELPCGFIGALAAERREAS